MATKDWRRTYNGKELIVFKKEDDSENRFIEIEDISGKPFVKNTWAVTGRYKDGGKFIQSTFNGKRQAIT